MAGIYTNAGHKLTFREAKFIEYVTAGKSEKEAYYMAGFNGENPTPKIRALMGKKYISDELAYRFQKAKEASIADATEILQYYSDTMRGLNKDQFGLDASLAERTKAANELAKRLIDFEREKELKQTSQEFNINFNWDRNESKGEENEG